MAANVITVKMFDIWWGARCSEPGDPAPGYYHGILPMTSLELCDAEVPDQEKLYLLLRPEVIEEPMLHELAVRFAQDEAQMPRERQAIEGKRAWIRNEISDAALFALSRDTAATVAWATGPEHGFAAGAVCRATHRSAARRVAAAATWGCVPGAMKARWEAAYRSCLAKQVAQVRAVLAAEYGEGKI